MASVKLINQIMDIIDPGAAALRKKSKDLEDMSKKELEDLNGLREDVEAIIEAVEDHQATTMRLLVVGQIQYDGSEEVYTVALGPYGARGVLSDPEKFKKAAEASTKAHEAGGRLAWDTKTQRGKGKYMVVPVFRTPRDAWDFYRDGDAVRDDVEEIVEAVPYEIVPPCTCGLRPGSGHQAVMGIKVEHKCHRHVKEE